MHWPGIEPGPPAWQARILPLNHQCFVYNHLHNVRCFIRVVQSRVKIKITQG